jgi:murein DD-endopeptidase MepM/ murein hydrolase activator NlpD
MLKKILKGLKRTTGASLVFLTLAFPYLANSQEQPVIPTENQAAALNTLGDIELGNLIEKWATEMNQVYAETRIQNQERADAIFDRLGVKDNDFRKFVRTLKVRGNPFNKLVPGRVVQARLTPEGKALSVRIYQSVEVDAKEVGFAEISRASLHEKFKYENGTTAFEVQSAAVSATVKTTVAEAAAAAKIPANVMAQVKDLLDGRIDFSKDVAEGDSFSVVYERRQLNGADLGSGRLLALEFYNKGKKIDSYWYASGETSGYFDADGNAAEQSFIRMPTAARVTSEFNRKRYHPITKKVRPHWGIDLAAPNGTPIYAASSGKITTKTFQRRGYGNWLVIDHGRGYETVYAHMSRFAAGIKAGDTVKKGQLIGYVGRTGLATGPHLHYELRKDGQQINPLTAPLPTADRIDAQLLAGFQTAIAPYKRHLAMLDKLQVAQATTTVSQ